MAYKFQIGDYVKFHSPEVGGEYSFRHNRFRVLSRQSEECPGGTQIKYMVRDTGNVNAIPGAWINEFELEPWTEEDMAAYWEYRQMGQLKTRSTLELLELAGLVEKELEFRGDIPPPREEER